MTTDKTTHFKTQQARKDDHLHYAGEFYQKNPALEELDGVEFIHHALPECKVEEVSLKTKLASLTMATPFFINAMTGGSDQAEGINTKLAALAQETGLVMALGSMSILTHHPELEKSYKALRKNFPQVRFLANLGAHHGLENAKRVVECVEAKALQIHLNAPQEIAMPEGDRDFTGWLKNIEAIVNGLERGGTPIPVIVKEVGFGLSKETVTTLYNSGVRVVDCAGKSGTNFIQIEDARRESQRYPYLYNWGVTTLRSLIEIKSLNLPLEVIASGGVRHPLDMAKYLALGAKAIGMANPFLQLVSHNPLDKAIEQVRAWEEELRYLLAILGVTSLKALQERGQQKGQLIFPPSLTHYLAQRGVEID